MSTVPRGGLIGTRARAGGVGARVADGFVLSGRIGGEGVIFDGGQFEVEFLVWVEGVVGS